MADASPSPERDVPVPGPGDYARAVFRAYEMLQVGTDPRAVETAEHELRAVNEHHPLLRELSRKSALLRVRAQAALSGRSPPGG